MIRESVRKDFAGTIKQIAKMGYAGVESAGNFGGMSPSETRKLLDEHNLKLLGGHVRLDVFGDGFDRVCEEYAVMGAKYLGLAGIAPDKRNAAGYEEIARILTKAAPVAAKHGITVFYHNHEFEFDTLPDGRTGYDILKTHTPPEVKFEIDAGWVAFANLDPVTEMGKLKGRLPLLHIKDVDAKTRGDAITGEGVLDLPAIWKAAETGGVDWFVLEMDETPLGELESAAACIANIKVKRLM